MNCGAGEDSWEFFGLQGDQTINPKGNLLWIFIGRTDADAEAPILWLPDVESQLIRKGPDTGKDRGQEEKGVVEDEMGMTEGEMVGRHHWLDGREFDQAPGIGDGQEGLSICVCCSLWGRKELDTTERLVQSW